MSNTLYLPYIPSGREMSVSRRIQEQQSRSQQGTSQSGEYGDITLTVPEPVYKPTQTKSDLIMIEKTRILHPVAQ